MNLLGGFSVWALGFSELAGGAVKAYMMMTFANQDARSWYTLTHLALSWDRTNPVPSALPRLSQKILFNPKMGPS